MKKTTLEQFAQDVQGFMAAAQHERIVVTRNGQPFAMIVGVANKGEEDLRLEASTQFWRMIQERRREPTLPLEDIKAELLAGE